MKHCGTKQLETDRLILRKFVLADANAMYRNWASDAEVTKYLTWAPYTDEGIAIDVLKEWTSQYTNDDYYQWAIVLKDNGNEPIGSISVVHMNEKTAMMNIGYCIGQSWWNQGIMSEALQRVIDFLFDEVEANRIEAQHDTKNPNSGKVMMHCGMTYEGTLKSAGWNNQGICDLSCYAVLKND